MDPLTQNTLNRLAHLMTQPGRSPEDKRELRTIYDQVLHRELNAQEAEARLRQSPLNGDGVIDYLPDDFD